jgi:sulfoxide reductase heme-binding subunit YedZ
VAKRLVISSVALSTPVLVLTGCLWSDATRYTYYLGADPVEYSLHALGVIAALLLLAALFFSPLRRLGWLAPSMMRYRRPVGVACFFYALLHALLFAQFYVGWSGKALATEFASRPYILMGGGAVMFLGVLAATSNDVSMRRLGAKWRVLHQLIYPASGLFLVHHLWQVRADYFEFVLFLCGFSLLFAERLWRRARRWSSAR